MLRVPCDEREDWQSLAHEFGFKFHTMYGEKYWDESAYYQFTLEQIERDIEAPTENIHQMCLEVVQRVVNDEALLRRFAIPEQQWELLRDSWKNGDPSLYSRLDFAYNGRGDAKLYENNADTPTSIYETGFWQWLWLENKVDSKLVQRDADQFNSVQEKLVNRFKELNALNPDRMLYFACCKDTEEDRGTVQYLEDCAKAAGLETAFVYIEDIGMDASQRFTDLDNQVITWIFKLYPWEFMFEDEYSTALGKQNTRWLEPPWKSIISNKALLPMLWQMFEGHPNLLPAFFEDELGKVPKGMDLVKKPIFSREGANITFTDSRGRPIASSDDSDGPYGEEGFIFQQNYPLPIFEDNHTLIGSWLIDDQAAGISVREDKQAVTQDMSRYLPHIIY
ncbi:glutathionylspermidine synthase family protein [Ningiella sp. W23]|uniref:glutathionylspermidine synthase family protein n=1 Tax=Ningiella sp. W23 TaxID=3023715 RepID=UPI00375747D8